MGDFWVSLMDVLGYDKFGAHGGDWGAGVTARLGHSHADRMIGVHVTAVSATPHMDDDTPPLTEAEEEFLRARAQWREDEGAYGHIQGTKPQTLSYGLMDSPVGLAAWIVEKFRGVVGLQRGCGERLYKGRVADEYHHLLGDADDKLVGADILRVAACAADAGEGRGSSRRRRLWRGSRRTSGIPPREYAERVFNLQQWTEMPDGGHFAALEKPEALVEDLRSFFRPLR